MRITFNDWCPVEKNNELLEKGFKWRCQGDYEITGGIDPWSGLPYTSSTLNYFDSYAEAEEFINTQTHPLFEDFPFRINEVQHRETSEEKKAREEAIKNKKAEKEKEKAEALGLTVKEYRRYKYLKGKVNSSLPNEITRLEKELEKAKRSLAHYKKEFTELENKRGKFNFPLDKPGNP